MGFTVPARIRSFRHAFQGVWEVVRTQHNAWIHATATILVVALGLWIHVRPEEWLAIALAVTLVWSAEAINTAFEALCDIVSPEFHPGVKRAKDVAAGAVLIAAIGSLAVAAVIFIPRILALIP